MAKDGTNRGGARIGAGRKPKALSEKIRDGNSKKSNDKSNTMMDAAKLDGVDVPPIKEYMKAAQKNGGDLPAEQIYREVFSWLYDRGCEKLVSTQLIEQYAMAVSRWIQCEEAISEFGFLAKHPTTGNAIASPYVAMSQQYMKQSNQIWYQIYQVVKDNSATDIRSSPHEDMMERILSGAF